MKQGNADNVVLSLTVSSLRLPMAVLVVFIHTQFATVMIYGQMAINSGQFPVYCFVEQILCSMMLRMAVPFFFFVSGYFFFKSGILTMRSYIDKLKRRANTLLLPYMVWNMLYMLLYFATQKFLPSYASGRNMMLLNYGFADWIRAFWVYSDGMPICGPLWFLRDLMLVMLFAPLLYFMLKKLKAFTLVVFAVLYLYCPIETDPSIPFLAAFYFSFGAWFSLRGSDFAATFSRYRWSLAAVCFILAVVDIDRWLNGVDAYYEIRELLVFVEMMMVIGFVAHSISKKRSIPVAATMAGAAFFVFAFHSMPIALARKLWVTLLPINELSLIVGLFVLPLLISAIGVGMYWLVRRYCAKFAVLLTGGR